ncbi:DNA-binding transcriptional regulator, FadR family [Anaerosporobacter mobilis DSM 15930]|jgi:DNA-binding FadR family transcriptional regulator|uniref:DNA-binding transcriptional regulator, FadR family n=1 Tax=Anaerosporobacter mobilis DSM 15930 TaxID=1120996 RepID=A0A1M7HS63_9FIRM|nr:GntR family transcriptional regulator [Anaerosporobacter mobilis]SHM31356.1 DNA-binding transcriptional regulator, FadR family [Anaerosporobacter mobilis DSM 15930]
MQFEKLCAPSLKELFIQQLETMILSGKLPVGEKLPAERELAETMQVSRAVINAGIAELARKGFLTIKPRVGTFVADYRRNGTIDTLISIMNYNGGILRDDEIRSILELRLGLDSLAINLCIPKITDDELHSLKEKVNSLLIAQTPEEASTVAFAFQHELAYLSGNTLMPLIFSSFRIPVITLWERFCRLYGIETLYENTLTLYQCIEERDSSKAIEWLNTSINDTIHGNRQIYY